MTGKASLVWAPQPGPQALLLKCPVYEVFYGGARGGGKTDAMIGGDWPVHAYRYGQYAKGIFFRRTMPQLEAAIARSKELYYALDATWREQQKTWVFANGATLKFRHLERDGDAELYQGHDYTRLYFEELTNYPSPVPIDKLRATLRSGRGVPCGFRATGNPGGPGHQWVKARYIDPAPHGWKVLRDDTGLERVYIPARVADNRILTNHDPDYVARLKQSGSEQLVRAWLDGDWDIIEGAFFDCWDRAKHVIASFALPATWTRFRAMDWGSAAPFCVQWYAIVSNDTHRPEGMLPRGALVCYREWYGAKAPNVGLKMPAEAVGAGIAEREKDEKIAYGVLDPAAFAEDGGPSIHERIMRGSGSKVVFRRADNKRVSQAGRSAGPMGGWDGMRARLLGVDGRPMLYYFNTCVDAIRTIPAMQHDANRPEDVDTAGEDHAGDTSRYACSSRPWLPAELKPTPKRDRWDKAFGDTKQDNWKVV